jgi:hypothetical protein
MSQCKGEWNIDRCAAVWNGMSEVELEIINRAHEALDMDVPEETVRIPVSFVNRILSKIMRDDVDELEEAAVEIITRIERLRRTEE